MNASATAREGPPHWIVVGAGPAGLTAALELVRNGVQPLVLERDGAVGGISRTETHQGFHFDMGGHRFFTKSDYVSRLWEEMLGPDLLTRPRLSRIYYGGRLFHYPPRLWDTLTGFGLAESAGIVGSYLRWQICPHRPVKTFEDWVTNAFGKRLFEIFFRSYSEKVWGISCSELQAEWAAQRIRDLSLPAVMRNFFLKSQNRIATLIDTFRYPRRGPGMMWQAVAAAVCRNGGEIRLNTEVVALRRQGQRIRSLVVRSGGGEAEIAADHVVSTMPVTHLLKRLEPPPDPSVLAAAGRLRHRDFLTVCLIVEQARSFPDNWIYVHEPRVSVARIQNFGNWSRDMVPDPSKTSLGLEYFCHEGDARWSTPDAELLALGARELRATGLVPPGPITDGRVFRIRNAYPMYDSACQESLMVVRAFCDRLENLRTAGRSGLHRYNNQDHSMLTGRLAAHSLLYGAHHDLWDLQPDEYLEASCPDADAREGGRT